MPYSRKLRSAVLIVLGALSISAYAAEESIKKVAVPAGPLTSALKALAEQSGVEFLYSTDQLEGLRTEGVHGEYTAEKALLKLLEGTRLKLTRHESGALVITIPETAAAADGNLDRNTIRLASSDAGTSPILSQRSGRSEVTTGEDGKEGQQPPKKEAVEEIVVTGTHIKGARLSSPLVSIGREEIDAAGQNNLGEVIRALPQNFSGGQNPAVGLDATAGSPSNANFTGASGLNLRGLGPDATLTLFNGNRLPYDGVYQAIDISAIPVSAISRVEILLDGASAIYGSDAVGGVANVVLRDDLDGAELSTRYGFASDGGYEQQQHGGVAGRVWRSGHLMAAGDYTSSEAVFASDRDFARNIPRQDVTLYPEVEQRSFLLSGRQSLGERIAVSLDAFYNERSQFSRSQNSASAFVTQDFDATSWAVAPSLHFDLDEWSLGLHGAVGRNEVDSLQRTLSLGAEAETARFSNCYCNWSESAGFEAEGPLFELPDGDARLSIGGGYRRNSFEQTNLFTGATLLEASDKSEYVYGEINLPLVAPEQDVPLVSRFSLNAAVRHENYESFGDTTTPKLGAVWGIVPWLDLRVSWGRSFKVPTLEQQNSLSQIYLLPGPAGAPAGSTILFDFGGNPELGPERAEIITVGFVAMPLRGLRIEAGWFDIDYFDRVTQPLTPLGLALTDPGNPLFAEFVTFDPSVAEQDEAIAAAGIFQNLTGAAYDPSTVYAVLHNRNVNAAVQRVSGFDVAANYAFDTAGGDAVLSANVNWVDGERQLTRTQPVLPAFGIIYFPPEFRARLGASWSRDGLTVGSYLNRMDGVLNNAVSPGEEGDAMTTVDLVIGYAAGAGALKGVRFNLAATNLFDEAPPFMRPVQPFRLNYDSTNYSALGRVISFQITKRW